ncbi:MAG: hypothetical protein M3Y87_10640, partial [Myxococcota bacterium]|nr:hypothetical protein [Myxococcota bacterium]
MTKKNWRSVFDAAVVGSTILVGAAGCGDEPSTTADAGCPGCPAADAGCPGCPATDAGCPGPADAGCPG